MAYQVLARKWRPLTFKDVVNQNHVKTTLQNAISQNRIAHAYIFSGPRGIGKTTIARIFARAVNCEKGPTREPCNKCTPCLEIIEDRSMDVLEVDGASNRGIDDVRNIRENIRYSPVHGKYRIYIIDEVHMLTREAFNALLKTLEEPPSHVLFIFATTEFQKIPATIVSRCQRFDFKRISVDEIVKQLRTISSAESLSVDDEALILLARRSEGSMRDAESLLDQLVSFCGTTINKDDVFDIIGMIKEDIFFSCSEAVISKNLSEAFTIAQKVFDEGYDYGELINGLIEHFRNILVVILTGSVEPIETSEHFKKKYEECSQNFSEMDCIRIINTISDAEYQIKKSTQPLLRLELLLSKLIAMDRSVSIEKILSQIEDPHPSDNEPKIESKNEGSYSPDRVQESAPGYRKESQDNDSLKINEPASQNKDIVPENKSDIQHDAKDTKSVDFSDLSIDSIKGSWDDFVDDVQSKNALTGSFLKEGTPVEFADNKIQISFNPENGFHIHSIERNREIVNQFLEVFYGTKLGFTCVKREFSKEEKEKTLRKIERTSKKDQLQKILEREPIIKAIIDTFGGESVRCTAI